MIKLIITTCFLAFSVNSFSESQIIFHPDGSASTVYTCDNNNTVIFHPDGSTSTVYRTN